jgi:hypothetical protein
MSIVWQQRIQHFDRPVKLTKMRGMRLTLLKSAVKEKRGYPSGSHSSEYVFAKLEARRVERQGGDAGPIKDRLLFLRLRERMLERKRTARRVSEMKRRPSVKSTKINLARNRRQWLAQEDAMRASWEAEAFLPERGGPASPVADEAGA